MDGAPESGTYHLDGLLEGPLGDGEDTKRRLADWLRICQKAGYGFSLRIEGDRFGLLADDTPRAAPGAGVDVSEPLRDLIGQLVGSFPPPEQSQVFSTVRSIQWGEGVETQTIYQVMPDGRVEAQQRTVEAETRRPPAPLTGTDRVKLIGIGLLVLFALFGITSLFIDWGDQFSRMWRKVAPIDTAAIATDLGAFEPYLTVQDVEAKGSVLSITLERTDAFPQDVEAADRALDENGLSYAQQQVLHALAAGYVRLEAFAKDGKHQATVPVRIANLREKKTMVLDVKIRRETPPATLRFTW